MSEIYEPIQASGINAGGQKSDTELARQVAHDLGWVIQPYLGSIHESDGTLIAENIEAVAAAGIDLGWFLDDGRGIHWKYVRATGPRDPADQVRRTVGD